MTNAYQSDPTYRVDSATSIDRAFLLFAIGFWFVAAACVSSRSYLVLNYFLLQPLSGWLEPMAAPAPALCVLLVVAGIGCWRCFAVGNRKAIWSATAFLVGSGIPTWVIWVQQATGNQNNVQTWQPQFWQPQFWEPLLLGAGCGFAAARLGGVPNNSHASTSRWQWLRTFGQWLRTTAGSRLLVGLAFLGASTWSYWLQHFYFDSFLLGFNDFGHFSQRIASTANGQGLLLETPVLPAFWDHFNPILLVLVPLWKLVPNVELIFVVQAISLASGGVFIFEIARRCDLTPTASALWSMSWFCCPSVTQMSIAYTYGWHPVSFAIPILFGALLSWMTGQRLWTIICLVLAIGVEENVIIMICLFCGWQAVIAFAGTTKRFSERMLPPHLPEAWSTGNWRAWLACSLLFGIIFVAVFRFSGLAEFQTARFVALGDSPFEILFSFVLKPDVFWGQVLRARSFYFIGLLLLPIGISIWLHAWRWAACCLVPLGVLLVWDHLPAQSIAFQYPTVLLPVLYFSAIRASGLLAAQRTQKPNLSYSSEKVAWFAGGTSLVLSIWFGLLPWSGETLTDVVHRTYAAELPDRREIDARDQIWLKERIGRLQSNHLRVLATGRIAAHFVGSQDIETVGQFFQRRDALAELTPTTNPLLRYDVIILDQRENFQQSTEQTAALREEIRTLPFRVADEAHGILIFRQTE